MEGMHEEGSPGDDEHEQVYGDEEDMSMNSEEEELMRQHMMQQQ